MGDSLPIIGYGISDGVNFWEAGSFKQNAIKKGHEIANANQMVVYLVEISTIGHKRIGTIFPDYYQEHIL